MLAIRRISNLDYSLIQKTRLYTATSKNLLSVNYCDFRPKLESAQGDQRGNGSLNLQLGGKATGCHAVAASIVNITMVRGLLPGPTQLKPGRLSQPGEEWCCSQKDSSSRSASHAVAAAPCSTGVFQTCYLLALREEHGHVIRHASSRAGQR